MGDILDLAHVRLTDRPLAVCDVDDVVLEFFAPFQLYLESLGHRFLPRSFRLHGNIVSAKDETPVEDARVSQLILDFFEAQEAWQTPTTDAIAALKRIGAEADVVFLTAMPPRYTQIRRRLLDSLDLTFPLLATEEPKGPVVRELHGERDLPVAFIDDMARNLHSVGEHVPECLLIQMVPPLDIHKLAPPAAPHVVRVGDWSAASQHIDSHFTGTGAKA